MEEVGSVLAPNGEAGLACANDALIVTLAGCSAGVRQGLTGRTAAVL